MEILSTQAGRVPLERVPWFVTDACWRRLALTRHLCEPNLVAREIMSHKEVGAYLMPIVNVLISQVPMCVLFLSFAKTAIVVMCTPQQAYSETPSLPLLFLPPESFALLC